MKSNRSYTIDASVFIKIIIKEDDSHLALKLMHSIKESKIINPTLFEYEIMRICITTNTEIALVTDLLYAYKMSNLELKQPTLKDINKAKEIMDECKNVGMPSFYDAIYHAIAINNGSTFVTADNKYFHKVCEAFNESKGMESTILNNIMLLRQFLSPT